MIKAQKRKVEIVVISDVHLGTYGCKAKELLEYLKSVNPKTIILNGDIIDIWQFKKSYFPKAHLKVIKYLMTLITKGTKVYYVTGNHDEMLRKFVGFKINNFEIVNKVVFNLNGKKAWFFHGDIFDISMKHSKWAAKLGGKGYDLLIRLNGAVNWILEFFGQERISFSKKIKNAVKGAVKHINNFEETAAEIAVMHKYDYVVCGHIHAPVIKKIYTKNGKSVQYLNSGDWVENLSSLEYNLGKWTLYNFNKNEGFQYTTDEIDHSVTDLVDYNSEQLLQEVFNELYTQGSVN